ncbi:MAG TPA: VCBS repeat-containing protein [Chthoniobacteraceae bacterium]|nr:VCBS repeat-containing protein [Chthoniobacteraceae bacterium]
MDALHRRSFRNLRRGLGVSARNRGEGAEFKFRHHFIDRDLPGNSYGQTALVDIDKDGDLDFVTGGKDAQKSVYWFEYRGADDWVRHLIGTDHPSDVGGATIDVDGDGWLDHITGGVWYRNSGKPRSESFERIVFDKQLNAVHDLVAGDLDGDRRIEIVTRLRSRFADLSAGWAGFATHRAARTPPPPCAQHLRSRPYFRIGIGEPGARDKRCNLSLHRVDLFARRSVWFRDSARVVYLRRSALPPQPVLSVYCARSK